MVVWFCARHVLYLTVCYSVWADIPREITYGCYRGSNSDLQGPLAVPNDIDHLLQPFQNPKGLVCWDNGIKWGFLGTLLALQVILLIWFGMIVRVALKVLQGGEAEDSRSDDEVSEDEEDDDIYTYEKGKTKRDHVIEIAPLEEEVGVDAINLATRKTSPTKKFRKSGSAASGVHLPSDTKELLGRIGCDKGA